jgi:hypothetical protein
LNTSVKPCCLAKLGQGFVNEVGGLPFQCAGGFPGAGFLDGNGATDTLAILTRNNSGMCKIVDDG